MARTRDEQTQLLLDIHQHRDELKAQRRQLQAEFDSPVVERRALVESLRHTALASKKRLQR